MRRRRNPSERPARPHRKVSSFEIPVDEAWDTRRAYREWLDEAEDEHESLVDELADAHGIEPADLDETELLESFLDAMALEDWQASLRRRIVN